VTGWLAGAPLAYSAEAFADKPLGRAPLADKPFGMAALTEPALAASANSAESANSASANAAGAEPANEAMPLGAAARLEIIIAASIMPAILLVKIFIDISFACMLFWKSTQT
jgi:hypothetical protein